ncbi:S1 family peptidase [Stackebrandtia albiflava]|uniref:S1 family peptidase n=1 Tax=Stackebrandtia albiflava TaxID=406432 RepID=UPI00131599BD|nr:serine protease [Stackebrandtia albiflava]
MNRRTLAIAATAALTGLSLLGAGPAHATEYDTTTVGVNIVGGSPATEDYEFMASLQYKDQGDRHSPVRCGASLISYKWLVTAAHCIAGGDGTPLDPSEYTVSLGSTDHTAGTEIDIEKFVPHPSWGEFGESMGDIGLIKLTRSAPYGLEKVRTAPAPAVGSDVRVLGWGFTAVDDPASMPTELQELDTTLLDRESCVHGDFYDITDNDICVDVDPGVQGPCTGDSGGPALHEVNGRWVVIGVNSRGPGETGCINGTQVYTATAPYYKWIVSHLLNDV